MAREAGTCGSCAEAVSVVFSYSRPKGGKMFVRADGTVKTPEGKYLFLRGTETKGISVERAGGPSVSGAESRAVAALRREIRAKGVRPPPPADFDEVYRWR